MQTGPHEGPEARPRGVRAALRRWLGRPRRHRSLREAYARLQEREERYRALAEFSADCCFCYRVQPSGERELLWANEALYRLSGSAPDTLLRTDWGEVVHPDDREAVAAWARSLTPGSNPPCEFRMVTPATSTRWVEARLRFDHEPGADTLLVFGSAQDVDARKRSELALRESRERYRALAESARDVNLETTAAGRLLWASPSLARVLGYDPDGVIGRSVFEFVHPEDQARALSQFEAVLAGKSTQRQTLRVHHRDGIWVPTQAVARLYRTSTGDTRVVSTIRDVSARLTAEHSRRLHERNLERNVEERTRELHAVNRTLRELQGRMLHAERLGAFEDLAGSVAHAINNPLTALIGTAELALEEGADEPMERVLRLAVRVRDVVSRTLTLYRQGRLDRTAEDPAGLLVDVREELGARARRQGVRLDVRAASGLPKLAVDRPLLSAALVSVAENALDVMPEGGVLWLEADALHDGDFIAFRVADTGPGIDPELRSKVFEPFYTTRGGGTGLGLSIARGVVQGHEGRLRIEDRPGGGALITVEIPVVRLGDARSGRAGEAAAQSAPRASDVLPSSAAR